MDFFSQSSKKLMKKIDHEKWFEYVLNFDNYKLSIDMPNETCEYVSYFY